MMRANPVYIPRNHIVETALGAAVDEEDYSKFEELVDVLSRPYEWRQGFDKYSKPAPGDFGPYKTFCGA